MAGQALSMEEREEVRAGLERDESFAVIARRLSRATSTVSREVGGNGGRRRYRAARADADAARARKRPKVPSLLASPALAAAVEKDLRAGFSPAGTAARLRDTGGPTVCTETIYAAVMARGKRGLSVLPEDCLRSRRRRRIPRRRGGAPCTKASPLGRFTLIKERPASAEDRSEAGHWEGDLIVGAMNRSAVITLIERQTRYMLLADLPEDHGAQAVLGGLIAAFDNVPEHLRLSLTWDQGREMAAWPDLQAATGLEVFFAEPHSPWQRGQNENMNRQLRFWMPKGTDLHAWHQDRLDGITDVLNHQPRRLLDWKTPADHYNALTLR